MSRDDDSWSPLLIVLVVLFVIGGFTYMGVSQVRCDDAGGVYFARELKCVKGIEVIKP